MPIDMLLLNLRNKCLGKDESVIQLNDIASKFLESQLLEKPLSVGMISLVCSSLGVWMLTAGLV